MSSPLPASLLALERLRRQQVQQCQRRVAEQQQRLSEMQSKIASLEQFLRSSPSSVATGLSLRNQDTYAAELRQLLRWQQQQYQAAEQELKTRRSALLNSELQHQRLETYGQQVAGEHRQQQQRQEQKVTDGLAALRFGKSG